MSREAEHGTVSAEAQAAGHEADRASLRPIALGAAALLGMLVIGFVVAWVLETSLQSRDRRESAPENPLAAALGRQLPPEPRLQVNPRRDLVEHRRAEQEILDGWGWVDRNAGVVHLPIARAMEILAQRGGTAPPLFPAPGPAAGAPAGASK